MGAETSDQGPVLCRPRADIHLPLQVSSLWRSDLHSEETDLKAGWCLYIYYDQMAIGGLASNQSPSPGSGSEIKVRVRLTRRESMQSEISILKVVYLFISDCAGSSLLRGLLSSCKSSGCSPVARHRVLTVAASLAVGHVPRVSGHQ